MRKLVAAAVRRNGIILIDHRHSLCIKGAVYEYGWTAPITQREQGFVDQTGVFYTREEAKILAMAWGQISKDFKGVLTSEDLW